MLQFRSSIMIKDLSQADILGVMLLNFLCILGGLLSWYPYKDVLCLIHAALGTLFLVFLLRGGIFLLGFV
jgi:hypothetical protein